jgi:DDE_Tnp_1-associated
MPNTDYTQPRLLPQANARGVAPQAPAAERPPAGPAQPQQQTLLCTTLATIAHFFGPPERWLAGIDDPRDARKITYPLSAVLFTGVWMFLCHLSARRQVAHKLRNNGPSAANFAQLFGVACVPHGDTLNVTYARLDPAQVQAQVTRLTATLIRRKVLLRARLWDRYYVIAIDGTGIYTFHQRHCAHCLTRTTQDGQTLYYHNVLEAKLVTPDGLAFSLLSEFIENPAPHPTKQDCELKAFYRLAARLKACLPRLPMVLALDSLFAGGPTFQLCRDYGWHYVIVLQEGDLPSVHEEFAALARLAPDQSLRLRTGPRAEVRQTFHWANQIDYRDTQGRAHPLSVLACQETKPQADGSRRATRFLWVTDFHLRSNQVRELAQNAGRLRWKIENQGFNAQKHGGFALEHPYSQDDTAAKVFYYLLQIAHLLFQLVLAGSLLQQSFPRGFGSLKNFAFRLLEAWRNCLLLPHCLAQIDRLRCQIRLDTS